MRKHHLAFLIFLTPAFFAGAVSAASFTQTPPPGAQTVAAQIHLCGAGQPRACCKNWVAASCAEKKDGKCVKWNYKCKKWGPPPCRER